MNQKQVIRQEEQEALNCEYCSQKKGDISGNRLLLLALLAGRDASKCLRLCKRANLALIFIASTSHAFYIYYHSYIGIRHFFFLL
jgi:hypothetical protein